MAFVGAERDLPNPGHAQGDSAHLDQGNEGHDQGDAAHLNAPHLDQGNEDYAHLEAAERAAALMTVGILADTHIPDRIGKLHPHILPQLRAAGAAHILHAGDISVGWVLEELRAVAPVTAVRGNRDLLLASGLALVEHLELGGVPIALMHGHGGWLPYLWDKVQFLVFGYRLGRYKERLVQAAGPARVVIFGHTHHPVLTWHKDVLLFNPGSASIGLRANQPPSMGLLHIYADGRIRGEILPLEGYKIKRRKWKRLS